MGGRRVKRVGETFHLAYRSLVSSDEIVSKLRKEYKTFKAKKEKRKETRRLMKEANE